MFENDLDIANALCVDKSQQFDEPTKLTDCFLKQYSQTVFSNSCFKVNKTSRQTGFLPPRESPEFIMSGNRVEYQFKNLGVHKFEDSWQPTDHRT